MSRKRQRRQEEPFQMAPMIDMVFLLLVFFMTVSTLAKEARPELELPLSEYAEVAEAAPPREIITVMKVKDGVQIYWHNRPVELEDLKKRLADSAKEESAQEVTLRGSPDLPWEYLSEVFDSCREAGLTEIIIATFES